LADAPDKRYRGGTGAVSLVRGVGQTGVFALLINDFPVGTTRGYMNW